VDDDLRELSRRNPKARRVFLTGANPIGLSQDKLAVLAHRIRLYLPGVASIGGYARIADIKCKSEEDLEELHELGFEGIHFETDTGDDKTLAYMNKGHTAADTIEQLRRLDEAGIRYNISFMNGLAGSGNGGRHALESARVFNATNPESINISNVPVFPESELYREILLDDYEPAAELEKLEELKLFIETITITTRINAGAISHAAPFIAEIPNERQQVLARVQRMLNRIGGKQHYDKVAYA
jgi:radical SAM superfamily enzyme YgiQ (UPF0313 family)